MGENQNQAILSCGTLSYREETLERALEGIAKAGFPGVEIGCVCGYCEHIKPEEMKMADMDRLAESIYKHGLTPVSIAGHIDFTFPLLGKGDEIAAEGFRLLRARIDVAEHIGTGIVNTGVGVSEGEISERFYTEFDNLLAYAEKKNVKIGLESHAGLTETAGKTIELCKRMGRESLGVNYDAANVIYYTGLDPLDDLRANAEELKDHLIHVHIKDHRGGKDSWDFPPLGEGDMDQDALAEIFRAIGFKGPYSLEIEFKGPDSSDPSAEDIDRGVAESYRFMNKLSLTEGVPV